MAKWKNRFHEVREQVNAIDGIGKKLQYIWQYYWIPIVAVVALVAFLITFTVHRVTTPNDNWFFAVFVNTSAEAGEDSELWKDFTDYGDFNLKEKNVFFNDNSYFIPGALSNSNGAEYYNMFVAYVEAGQLDVVVSDKDTITGLGPYGYLADLSDESMSALQKYADRFVYVVPDDTETYGTDPIPVGIDLSDTRLVTEYNLYPETCVLGVSQSAPHLEVVLQFLEFVTEGETGK